MTNEARQHNSTWRVFAHYERQMTAAITTSALKLGKIDTSIVPTPKTTAANLRTIILKSPLAKARGCAGCVSGLHRGDRKWFPDGVGIPGIAALEPAVGVEYIRQRWRVIVL